MAVSTDPIITTLGIVQFGTELPAHSSIYNLFKEETIIQLSCNTYHSAVVCKSGRVATFGKKQSNVWLADDDTLAEPTFVSALESIRIIQAACGDNFTYFLTDAGELYSSGCNDHGQLGLGYKNKIRLPLVKVIQISAIKKVAAGRHHVGVLTYTGEVWVTGCNYNGQLGIGHKESQTSFIHSSNVNVPIIDISCGANFTALLSTSGILMVSGSNQYGQLGLGGHYTNVISFQPVSLSSTVVSIACGYHHMVALTVHGDAWAWGYNENGQLGIGKKISFATPQVMVGLQSHTISQVFAGTRHTALLTEEGNVLVCGRGESGELGLPKETFLEATLLPKSAGLVIKEVAFSAFYTLMLVIPKPKYEPVKISDMEKTIMKSIECSICLKLMCAPIRLCAKGHNVCGPCWSRSTDCSVCSSPSIIEVRCSALESLSASLHLPCTDCLERMSLSLLQKHGEVCPKRQYSCPLQPELCIWRGLPETMLTHSTSAHNVQVVRTIPHLFTVNMAVDETLTDVLAVHDEIFTFYRRYNKTENIFYAAMRYIGAAENARNYRFEIEIFVNSGILSSTICKDICVYSETIEEMFQSDKCVCINNEQLGTCLQGDKLVCRVSIVRVQSGY